MRSWWLRSFAWERRVLQKLEFPLITNSASLGLCFRTGCTLPSPSLYNHSQMRSTWLLFSDLMWSLKPPFLQVSIECSLFLVVGGVWAKFHQNLIEASPSPLQFGFSFFSIIALQIHLSYVKLGLPSHAFPEKVICKRPDQGGWWLRHQRQTGMLTDEINRN